MYQVLSETYTYKLTFNCNISRKSITFVLSHTQKIFCPNRMFLAVLGSAEQNLHVRMQVYRYLDILPRFTNYIINYK
jgi:hypothetical protein